MAKRCRYYRLDIGTKNAYVSLGPPANVRSGASEDGIVAAPRRPQHAWRPGFRVAALLLLGAWAGAQDCEISGSVTDRTTQAAVQGAEVTVKADGASAKEAVGRTDAAGHFAVKVAATGKFTVVVTKKGYAELKVPDVIELASAASKRTVDISLTREGAFKERVPGIPGAMSWETGAGKSYVIPAVEAPVFLGLLSLYDRHAFPDVMENGIKVYSATWTSTQDHIKHGPWVIDQDSFQMNQFGHPYQGTVFHGFARSAGLNYWQALAYDNYGSLLWKMGGETDPPSINDQIATGISGSFFGEVLFRLSNLMLEGEGRDPGFWHKVGAGVLAPSAGINRLLFGERFKPVFPSNNPSLRWRLDFGAVLSSDQKNEGTDATLFKNDLALGFSMDYGLPGKLHYTYDRPFDYFQFEFRTLGNRTNPVDSVLIRGLLYGTDFDPGDSGHAIWGLYGGYDYLSPYIFRVSSTSLSVGTTFQEDFSPKLSLQGSLLGGLGFAAAGAVAAVGLRDYHYGIAPQGLAALRFIFADKFMADVTGRRYYITGSGGSDPQGREAINRLDAGLTFRIHGRHALGIQYLASTREAHYPDRPNTRQSVGTFSLVYNLLGYAGFGAIK